MKPLRKCNGRLGLGHVLVLGAVMLACLFLWISVIAPYLSTLLEPLQERSPFLHDVLRGLAGVSLLPWTFGAVVITLFLFQLRWDKTHSQQAASLKGGPAEPPCSWGAGGGPPSVS